MRNARQIKTSWGTRRASAFQVLECGKGLRVWGAEAAASSQTYHDLILRDKEIVKLVLLLTGSVEGV